MNDTQHSPMQKIEWDWKPYPEQALNEIIADKEKYLGQMRAIMQRVIDEPDFFIREENYMGHLFAVYLLSLWRDTESFELIIDAFVDKEVDIIWNDILHEIGRFIVSTWNGNLRKIVDFIKNDGVDKYVRMNAFGGLVSLFFRGKITREQLLEISREIIRDCLCHKNQVFFAGFICECCDFYCPELLEDIRNLFEKNLVDTDWVSFEHFAVDQKNQINEIKARGSSLRQPIEDIHAEMRDWAMFMETEDEAFDDYDGYWDDDDSDEDDFDEDDLNENYLGEDEDFDEFEPQQVQSNTEKYPGTGRNDPCPCGSGKKYKKCCLE